MTAPEPTYEPSLQEELEAFLAFAHGGVLLWHDPEATYEATLDALRLPEDTELVREDRLSQFTLLRRLNEMAPDETILLYRKRRHRVETDDWLADLEAYAECFSPTESVTKRPAAQGTTAPSEPEPAELTSQSEAADLAQATGLDQDWYTRDVFDAKLAEAGIPSPSEAGTAYLGFRLFDDCALRATYGSLADYYRTLFSAELVARASLPTGLSKAPSFKGFLSGRMAAGLVYDYDEHAWISQAGLAELGITAADLDEFAQQAVKCSVACGIPQFTVPWLRTAGQSVRLLEYGLEDCFYESVLLSRRQLVTRGQLGGRRIFAEPHEQANGRALVASLVLADRSIDLEALLDMLREDYGIPVQRSQLLQLLRATDLFYSPELDRAYQDHDQFVREVE